MQQSCPTRWASVSSERIYACRLADGVDRSRAKITQPSVMTGTARHEMLQEWFIYRSISTKLAAVLLCVQET